MLIQEGVKRRSMTSFSLSGLRALLIQEGVKLFVLPIKCIIGLRALLIQEGVKSRSGQRKESTV